ncbi:hypothetical protein F5878DRAFT_662834 [Lentinula raphanica]|uniref:Uncharacterized protein n=1 Tax=Lentinula raphanica TaxID=153919 RepID=A0AA38P5C3_9AGAR|nr:hypothetical protein F5878DRAFT_662834 [Lentinula raphanica]
MFRNAFHAPTIASNLISIGLLDKLGWTARIGQSQITFHEPNGQEIFGGKLVDGLYLLEGSFVGDGATALTACSLTHIGQAVELLDRLKIENGEKLQCEDCTIANHKRRPFDGDPDVETEPLERVCLDIFGPSHVPSVGGNYYAMVLVD